MVDPRLRLQEHPDAASSVSKAAMSDPAKRIAPRVSLIYALFGLLWILATDLFTGWLSADTREVIVVETIKGALFVGISAALLYWYVR
ncbi:MAG TPA: hypothetical protein VFZ59_25660, partial [Verrucomicrobiae bacterium]|nr:hypothetical protein [Verrucomicrobiae bacterium]